jgi:hypothetical protein
VRYLSDKDFIGRSFFSFPFSFPQAGYSAFLEKRAFADSSMSTLKD